MKHSGPLFALCQAAVVSAFLVMVPAVGRAVEITIEPAMPTGGDRVQIVVCGVMYPSLGPTSFAPCVNVSCWPLEGGAFGMGVCDYPGGLSSSKRPLGEVAYGEIGRSDLGVLSAGHYVVQATIYEGTSPGPRIETLSFDVAHTGPGSGGDPNRLESLGPNPS